MNYVRALSDFITNFSFSDAINFRSPKQTEAIVPSRLKRVWETDNKKEQVLWEMGNQGSITGDVFVKIAYEEPHVDGIGRIHPGKVRILPLNSSFCFPEWHPHDRTRLLRFKLKYRFWGTSAEGTRQVFCVDDQTEALTRRGWKKHSEITTDDEVLGIDSTTKVVEWQPVLSMHRFDYEGDLVHWTNSHGFDALTTPNHRWLTAHRDSDGYSHFDAPGRFMTTEELSGSNKQIITGGGIPQCFASTPVYSDEFVELIGWAVTEGHYQKPPARTGVLIGQSETANPEGVQRLRRLVKHFADQGASASEQNSNRSGVHAGSRDFYFGKGIGNLIRLAAPDKTLPAEFLGSLTQAQAVLLYETMLDGDGHRAVLRDHDGYNRTVSTETFIQNQGELVDGFQMLAAMLGRRTKTRAHHDPCTQTTAYARPLTTARHLADERVPYQGIVWCPRTPTQTWLARRNGGTFWTGNTYTEILTEDHIEEYVNDELLDSRPNPLGTIPVVHIANIPVSGSPWGLADIQDIVSLNREYNEKATAVSDIINYHAAPVTVITGAKASQLEKGPKKVWGGLPKDAQVFNLELGTNLAAPMEYLGTIKRAMHELTGVPETALGQQQPISNTSGVALAIQYQPLMNRFNLKKIQYGIGFERINELVMLTLAVKEPQTLQYNPDTDPPFKEGQVEVLDPSDPITYQTHTHWPAPLPTDVLIKLNEEQMMMGLGLQSKRGALRALGHEEPEERIAEINAELHEDAVEQAALDLLKTTLMNQIAMVSGTILGPDGEPVSVGDPQGGEVSSAGGDGVTQASAPMMIPGISEFEAQGEYDLLTQLVTRAYGTKIAQRRNPENSSD